MSVCHFGGQKRGGHSVCVSEMHMKMI